MTRGVERCSHLLLSLAPFGNSIRAPKVKLVKVAPLGVEKVYKVFTDILITLCSSLLPS